jgi:hypothetical protein
MPAPRRLTWSTRKAPLPRRGRHGLAAPTFQGRADRQLPTILSVVAAAPEPDVNPAGA